MKSQGKHRLAQVGGCAVVVLLQGCGGALLRWGLVGDVKVARGCGGQGLAVGGGKNEF